MKNYWKMCTLGWVAAVMGVVLLGAVSPGRAADADNDGVEDAMDACPNTVIPEGCRRGVTPLALCAH